jgi:phospholipase/carboxylesterase
VGLPDHLLLVPDRPAPRAPLLVWFHGAGGHAALGLATVQTAASDVGALVLLPSSSGTTWDLLTSGVGRDAAALDVALEHVFASYDVDRVGFAGFSDGASYALSLGLANGDLAEVVLAFSPGFAAPPEVVGRPRCWLAHGTADAVLPVDRCGRRVAGLLEREGYAVHYEEFAGGHVVRPDDIPASLSWWLTG